MDLQTWIAFAAASLIMAVIPGLIAIARIGAAANSAKISEAISARAAFLTNVAVGIFHPKTILLFVAFASQFVRPDASFLAQAATLVATFTGFAAPTDTLYALTASRASGLVLDVRFWRWAQRARGGALLTAGVATAAMRR